MTTRDIVRIALFAAFIGALGLLPKFDMPLAAGVPVTAQTLGVMLAGVFLGARNGALAATLFVFVVALGVPLLAGGRGGLAPFFSPTVGFFVGFIPAAFVAGFVMERLRGLPVSVAAVGSSLIGGIVVLYALGIPGLAWKANMSLLQAATASMVFLPGDLLKAGLAGLIAHAAARSVPQAVYGR